MRPAFHEPEEFVVRSPFGGLADGVTPDVLQEADLSHVRNFDFDRRGLTKRFGRALINTLPDTSQGEALALFHYRSDAAARLLIVIGTHLVFVPENGAGSPVGAISGLWPPTSADVIGSGLQMGAFVQFRDDAFYSDASASPQYYKGSTPVIKVWGYVGGQPPAPTDTGPAAGGALTPSKFYGVAYAYRDPIRSLSTNPSVRTVFQADATNLTEGFSAGAFGGYSADYTELIVLRTLACPDADTAAAATLRYEKTITPISPASFPLAFTVSIADGATQSWDGGTDNQPPPPMDFITLFAERIVGFKGSSVYYSKNGFSEEGGVFSFPISNEAPVEQGAGDDLGGLFVMQGQLYAAKQGAGVFLLAPSITNDGLLQFQVQKLTGAAVGCLARFGVAVVENLAYWIDDKGFVEFDGTNARIISEEPAPGVIGVRDTFLQYRDAGRLRDAYVCVDRGPFKHVVRWILWRTEFDSLGNLQFVTDQVIFDLVTRRWTVHHAGGDSAADRVTGLFERLVCYSGTGNAGGGYRDSDGRSHAYTADEDGNVYRLETDETGAYVYSDNGTPYTASMRTKFFGDGRGLQLPISIDVEMLRSRVGKNSGELTVAIHRDGAATVSDPAWSQAFPLWDESQSHEMTRAIACNADRKPCLRWAVGLEHSESDGDLTVLAIRGRASILGRTLRGT